MILFIVGIREKCKLTSYEKKWQLSCHLIEFIFIVCMTWIEITLKLDITNKNYPYVELNANEETFYVDEFLSMVIQASLHLFFKKNPTHNL